jgi:hypothetical protein
MSFYLTLIFTVPFYAEDSSEAAEIYSLKEKFLRSWLDTFLECEHLLIYLL